jgi:hypothetical protein
MSLQLSATFANGLTAPDAVHKVLEAQFTSPSNIYVCVGVFADLIKSQDGITPVIERRYFSMTGYDPTVDENMHTQVYNWLKTLPEYTGAADV